MVRVSTQHTAHVENLAYKYLPKKNIKLLIKFLLLLILFVISYDINDINYSHRTWYVCPHSTGYGASFLHKVVDDKYLPEKKLNC